MVTTLLGVWACGSRPPSNWVARVEALGGTVLIAGTPGDPLAAAKLGQFLRVGSRLETKASSQAILQLRNGGRLTIQPRSIVQFASEAPERQLRVGLKAGSVIGKASEVQAAELVIGLGNRNVRLSAAAAAEVTAEASTILVTFGNAEVEGPDGRKRTVIEGEAINLKTPVKPDAGPPRPDAKIEVAAPELVFFLQASGKGRVMIRRPGQRRFVAVRRGEPVEIAPGTEITVAKGASVSVGPEKGKPGTVVTGPAEVRVVEGPKGPDGQSALRLENTGNTMQVTAAGEPGKAASPFDAEGVKITPRVTYRRLELRVRKERGRSLLSVLAGEALLEGKGKKLRLEAGQEAFLQKGSVNGPHVPAAAPMEVRGPGAMRVFASSNSIPVTFRWTPGKKGALVEIGRSQSMEHPLFSDILQRSVLTMPQLPRGVNYWRVRKIDSSGSPEAKGSQGKLLLVKDTSYRGLKDRQGPKNTIHESFGNTTVFYQNVLPRFTFRWGAMDGGARYQLKIFREQSLGKPVLTAEARDNELLLGAGKLGEGTYIWYVAGRGADGALIRTTKSRKLTIRYDNATPDLQIIYPPNGISVGDASLETRGVTIPGSKVNINGVRAELDETYRFAHGVKLKAGLNHIIYQVIDPRRGSSYYLRQVTRQ